MSDTAINPADPQVLGGMCPYLNVDGAMKAAEFYGKAFGAETLHAVPPDEQGRTMHVHLSVNGSSLMLSDFYPDYGHQVVQPQAFTLQLHLTDDRIDEAWNRAVEAGCKVDQPLQAMFWGDRWGRLVDPFGVAWAMNAPLNKAG